MDQVCVCSDNYFTVVTYGSTLSKKLLVVLFTPNKLSIEYVAVIAYFLFPFDFYFILTNTSDI